MIMNNTKSRKDSLGLLGDCDPPEPKPFLSQMSVARPRKHSLWIDLGPPPTGTVHCDTAPISPLPTPMSGNSPSFPSSPIYRRHSRKGGSQVFVPPIGTSSSSSNAGLQSDEVGLGSSSTASKANGTSSAEMASLVAMSDESGGNSIVAATSFLMGAQFFGKIVTFGLNQALLRFIDPGIVGLNSQLELMINTVLFFSREAIRLATQRQTLSNKTADVYVVDGGVVDGTVSGTIQMVINIGFVPLVLGIPLAATISYAYYLASGRNGIPIILYALASIIELASEPSFLFFQLKMDFKTRAWVESVAVLSRCIVTLMFVMLSNASPLLAFALGQIAYSLMLSSLYIITSVRLNRRENFKSYSIQGVIPATDREVSQVGKIYVDSSIKQLALSIYIQTIFKHCLSEGDKFLVSILLPLADQGVYSLVVNYGSLIARLMFLPIEEALRNYFSKTLNTSGDKSRASVLSAWKKTSLVLTSVLRGYAYLSIFATIFGPPAAGYALKYLVSAVWWSGTNAADVLATYACYIPFLAINGALEAFVQSVASISDIKHQSAVMLLFSAIFAAAATIFMSPRLLNLGAKGLVLANMLNMSLRIGWCLLFVSNQDKEYSGSESNRQFKWFVPALPSTVVVVTSILSSVTAWFYVGYANNIVDMAKLVALAGVIGVSIAYQERSLLLSSVQKVNNRRREKKE